MHVILSYSSNKLKSCVKSKMTFYNKFLAQAYIKTKTNCLVESDLFVTDFRLLVVMPRTSSIRGL